jgi:hypothetical protein
VLILVVGVERDPLAVGNRSRAGSVVKRRVSADRIILMQISELSCCSPSQENATWLPSGENVGSLSRSGMEVSETTNGSGISAPLDRQRSQPPAINASAPARPPTSHRKRLR